MISVSFSATSLTSREERNVAEEDLAGSGAGRRGLVAVDAAEPETGFSRTAPAHPVTRDEREGENEMTN